MKSGKVAWVQGLVDCIFPPVCVHCGEVVEDVSPMRSLCLRCHRDLHLVRQPACGCCGFPFFGDTEGGRDCPHCIGLKTEFEEGRTVVLFRGAARSLMLELKYHQGFHVLKDMGRLAGESPGLGEWLSGVVLVPVPLHSRKRRERGFNQVEEIAVEIGRAFPGRFEVRRHLERVVDRVSQTRLDRAARMANLRGAFRVKQGAQLETGRRHVVFDDVFTTGSTVNSCARVLKEAGVERVDVLSFGHG